MERDKQTKRACGGYPYIIKSLRHGVPLDKIPPRRGISLLSYKRILSLLLKKMHMSNFLTKAMFYDFNPLRDAFVMSSLHCMQIVALHVCGLICLMQLQ